MMNEDELEWQSPSEYIDWDLDSDNTYEDEDFE